MEEKRKSPDILIGSMLFGMFFGAGNLIFPIFLGQQAGANIWPSIAGFLITATGIPFLGIVTMGLTGSKNVIELGSRVGRRYAYVFTVLLYLCIGPFFALPRTATVSFEVGLTPIVSEGNHTLALAIFTIAFFATALYFSLRPARILDWIGKFLNPIFLVFLGSLLILAIVRPMGSISAEAIEGYSSAPFTKGFIDGYQTMDALAALAFGSIVIETVKGTGAKTPKEVALGTTKAGVVSVLLMCLIYAGIAWLGATGRQALPLASNGGIAFANVSKHYLGSFGSLFLAITITVACLKTAIGLITSCSKAFMEMFPKSLNYNQYVISFTVFSCVVANVGLDKIIALALPMLMFLYPLAITLILLSLFERFFGRSRIVYVCVTIGAMFVAVGDTLATMPEFIKNTSFVQTIVGTYTKYIPFFSSGMGWIVPSAIGLIIGLILYVITKGKAAKTNVH